MTYKSIDLKRLLQNETLLANSSFVIQPRTSPSTFVICLRVHPHISGYVCRIPASLLTRKGGAGHAGGAEQDFPSVIEDSAARTVVHLLSVGVKHGLELIFMSEGQRIEKYKKLVGQC